MDGVSGRTRVRLVFTSFSLLVRVVGRVIGWLGLAWGMVGWVPGLDLGFWVRVRVRDRVRVGVRVRVLGC